MAEFDRPLSSRLITHSRNFEFSPFVKILSRGGTERNFSSIKVSDLYVHGNGIDLCNGYLKDKKPARYEETCFLEITSEENVENLRESLIIGPHIIDRIFPRIYEQKRNETRTIPDAVKFLVELNGDWAVDTLYEFKSGSLTGVSHKLEGFSGLIKDMRGDGEHFPKVLRTIFPWAKKDSLPQKILVPDDSDITVVFMSPKEHHARLIREWTEDSKFQVVFTKSEIEKEVA